MRINEGVGVHIDKMVCQLTLKLPKKQTTKFSSANFHKMSNPSYITLRIQRLEGNSVDLDEVAHNEPPHHYLRCLQIQLFSSLVLKEIMKLISISTST